MANCVFFCHNSMMAFFVNYKSELVTFAALFIVTSNATVCQYNGDTLVVPTAACTDINILITSRDESTILSGFPDNLVATKMVLKRTGITSLPDMSKVAATLTKLNLWLNEKLTTLQPERLAQLQKLEQLLLWYAEKLAVLPDLPLPNLWQIVITTTAMTSIPNLPQMCQSVTVSSFSFGLFCVLHSLHCGVCRI